MTRIEEQQKAINNLKANLMDDLNERGILSTPECERILDVHKQVQSVLGEKTLILTRESFGQYKNLSFIVKITNTW